MRDKSFWSFPSRFLQVVTIASDRRPLGGSSDSGSGRGNVLGLVLSLGVSSLDGLLSGGDGRLLGGSSLSNSTLLLDSLLSGLLLSLGTRLALDGSTELGESALVGLFLTLSRGRGLLTLAEVEGKRGLALLLDSSLGGLSTVSSSGLGVVSGSVDLIGKRSG